jgi:hypothetical protein
VGPAARAGDQGRVRPGGRRPLSGVGGAGGEGPGIGAATDLERGREFDMLDGGGAFGPALMGQASYDPFAIHIKATIHAAWSTIMKARQYFQPEPGGPGLETGAGRRHAGFAWECSLRSVVGREAGRDMTAHSVSGTTMRNSSRNAESKSKTSSKSSRRSCRDLRICPMRIRLKTISPKSLVECMPHLPSTSLAM